MDKIVPHPIYSDYGCDKNGNVYTRKNNKWGYLPDGKWKIKKPTLFAGRYYQVSITIEYKRQVRMLVHRLIAETFLPNVDNKQQVNHINNIGTDNRICNLEWATPSENVQHCYDFFTNKNKKLNDDIIDIIIQKNKDGWNNQNIANFIGVSKNTVQKITKNINNRYIAKGSNIGKLDEDKVKYIRNEYKNGKITYDELAELFGVSKQNVYSIIKRKTWKHI
jgi:DNA-binding XRE family transcriptional regulator